jgi:hypothetical protein
MDGVSIACPAASGENQVFSETKRVLGALRGSARESIKVFPGVREKKEERSSRIQPELRFELYPAMICPMDSSYWVLLL